MWKNCFLIFQILLTSPVIDNAKLLAAKVSRKIRDNGLPG